MPRLSRPHRNYAKDTEPGNQTEARNEAAMRLASSLRALRTFAAVSLSDFKPPTLPSLPQPKWLNFPMPLWVMLSPPGQPNKKRLMTVQDFFKYTEEEGRRFFSELDRNGDGRVTYDDIKAAMKRRNLPDGYAAEFFNAARAGRWWLNSITWEQFQDLVDEKEPKVLRAFTSMHVNPSGTVGLSTIQDALMKMGLPATEANAKAMLKALGGDEDGFVSYGKFRNFAMLLPEAKLQRNDPNIVWFESATVFPIGPPPELEDAPAAFLLKAALAGGIASGSSTFLMHPIDSLKTRIQSSSTASMISVIKSIPQIGVVSLYRGIIPATMGTFVGHGVRTFAYEASLKVLSSLLGPTAEVQAQGLASGVGTILGTSIRIPCEVMKQRLQIGRYPNVIAAFRGAIAVEGIRGLFRGTAVTLSREVPFYVLGMVGYQQIKKLCKGRDGRRELAPWQTVAIGFMSGAIAAVLTTPGDVMKTRIMTAPVDQAVNAGTIFFNIVRNEGVGALFKGALPRMVWTAPQGAMNFAGYELAKHALMGDQEAGEGTMDTSKHQIEGYKAVSE